MASSTKPATKKPVTPAKATAKKPVTAAKAPAKKVTAAGKAPVKKAAPAVAAKKEPVKHAPTRRKAAVAPEQRRNYIEVAAYYIAERHGFTPGRELTDWAAAEAEIDRLLDAGLLNS